MLVALALTACDESTEQPAPPPSASAPQPPLTREVADAVVASHRPALLAACADDLARAEKKELQLLFEIDAQGAVIDATAAGGGTAERPLRKCVEKQLTSWRFPAPDSAPKTISAALSLE